jgi:competence protein ComEC
MSIGWLYDPLLLFDISFVLSAAATAGLLLLSRPLAQPCSKLKSRLGRWVGQSIATTLAAMIPCAPLLALLGSDLTLAGVFANVLAAPLGEMLALPLCLLHAIASPLPSLEAGLALVASGALLVVRAIALESAGHTWLALPVPEPGAHHLALFAVFSAAFVLRRVRQEDSRFWRRVWLLAASLAVVAIELATRHSGSPKGELRMTALSVGQGDAQLLDFPDGSSLLVDAGGSPQGGADPGARIVVPTLRARRRARLDAVVLTHPHPDHFGGLLAVLNSVDVGELWDTGQGAAEASSGSFMELLRLARARGIPIVGPERLCGKPRNFGMARVQVLSPCPGFVRGRNANDNSFVLRVELGKRAFLLTGDAEAIAERELLDLPVTWLSADVLKTGHHGSRTSSSAELLDLVRPKISTISCGARNRFGHPAEEVVNRLSSAGSMVLRTDRDGAIQIGTDGQSLWYRSAYVASLSRWRGVFGSSD